MGEAARKLELGTEPGLPSEDDLEHCDEWAEEIDRRAEEMRSGRVQGVPWEDVTAEIKAKYGWD
jgi:hypothetical protein